MKPKTIPYKAIVDKVIRPNLLPAAYRWISNLNAESLQRFNTVFARLATDEAKAEPVTIQKKPAPLQASRYTVPEWRLFQIPKDDDKKEEDLLACPTCTHLTYGAFDEEQARQARAIPTRTRANDRSQINTAANDPDYMAKWSQRNMNTSYRHDICESTFATTITSKTKSQQILIYSKGVLSDYAMKRAEQYADVDPVWTREFREMCRNLADSTDATAYRTGFTEFKEGERSRFGVPKWVDPEPVVSRGKQRPAESFWETETHRHYQATKRPEETFHVRDQHRAMYSCPFDHHAITEKTSTCFHDDFQDHMANKDDHPEYFKDMKVRIPSGSAVVGDVLGTDQY